MAIRVIEQSDLEQPNGDASLSSKVNIAELQRQFALAAAPRLLKTMAWAIARLRPLKFWQKPSAVFVAPAKSGSLGDDAMLLAGMNYLQQQGFQKFSLVYPGTGCNWEHLDQLDAVVAICWPKEGIKRYTESLYQYLKLVAKHSHVFCVGADVMDGFYSEIITLNLLDLVDIANLSGAHTKVIGFSFNDHPKASAVDGLQQLPEQVSLLCRDAVSKSRLEKHVTRPISLVADAAFLLSPNNSSERVLAAQQWLAKDDEDDALLVGLNICSTLVDLELGLSSEDVAERYAQAFTQVASQHPQLKLLLMPHDTRGNISDVALLELFRQKLPSPLQERTYSLSGETTAPEAKALCAGLDLVVTGRMHLAIAALGQLTPVLGITYQGKFSGLFQHFELEGMTIPPAKSVEVSTFASHINEQLKRKELIRQQLEQKLPHVQSLAQCNFQID